MRESKGIHLVLSLQGTQPAHHDALGSCDLLVTSVLHVGERVELIRRCEPGVPKARLQIYSWGRQDHVDEVFGAHLCQHLQKSELSTGIRQIAC